MRGRVEWDPGVPAEIRASLAPHLERWGWVLPGWCQRVFVRYDPTGSQEGGTMRTAVNPEYRHVILTVCPAWITWSEAEKESDVIHELLHVPLAPMVEMVRDLLTRLLDEGGAPQFHGFAQDRWRVAFEGAVQDLAHAIQDRIE